MKKILLFLFIVMIPFITLAYPQGDVDGNGKVGSTDYVLVRKHLLKQSLLTGDKLTRADVNSDGKVSSLDYILIRKIIIGSVMPTNTPAPTTTPTPSGSVTGVVLNRKSLFLPIGSTETLIATVSPSNAKNKEVTWSSSNSKIVSVDQNGNIKALSKGDATITVTTKDGGKTATCKVTASVPVTGVSLNKTSVSITKGNGTILTATVSPSDATNKNVTWSSSDSNIVSVKDGVIEGKKVGTATITVATSEGNKTATCKVTVTGESISVSGVSLNKTDISLDKGGTETLTATVTPDNASNKSVTWSSSDTNVATVSDNGKVKAVNPGTAVITVTTDDGKKTATCKVTVSSEKYEVKYFGASIIETGLSSINLKGSEGVPVVSSEALKLSKDEKYVVSFDHVTSGSNNAFNVDLFPDTLPEVSPTATSSKQHYDWEVSSDKSDITNCKLRFFDNHQESNESDIRITNIVMGTVTKITRSNGGKLGNLPKPSRNGYELEGWYTSPTGGTKVTSDTQVTSNMTLYPHWKETGSSSTYDITDDFNKISKFNIIKEYNSSTLKYKVLKLNGENNRYYTVIWVADANKQINNAVPSNRQQIGVILNNEIKTYGYQKKGLIAINASFMWNNKPGTPVVMSHGKVVQNNGYSLPNYHNIGIDSNGKIVWRLRNDTTQDVLKDDGVRNTFAGNYCVKASNICQGGGADWRNEFGQIDNHNFVIFTGYLSICSAQKQLADFFGATRVCNMDGGGSTRLFYKYNNADTVTKILAAPTDPNRTLSDALYIVEQ